MPGLLEPCRGRPGSEFGSSIVNWTNRGQYTYLHLSRHLKQIRGQYTY
jgi:hypothetical protein